MFVQDVAEAESGSDQSNLWSRILTAASGDGYFVYLSIDGFIGHQRTWHQAAADAVTRVGFVRSVEMTAGLTFYVVSSFSDMPMAVEKPVCDWSYNGLCSIDYARRVLGEVTTKLLRATNVAELQQVLFHVSAREYNQQMTDSDYGFYPFVIKYDGTYAGHGANPALIGQNVDAVVASTPYLAGVTSSNLNAEMVSAAQSGGDWVAYWWRNNGNGDPYTKISYVVGVHRFGIDYYVGVGFNNVQTPLMRGPHCAECRIDYNYPCSVANVLSLFGHVQAILLMGNWYTLEETFSIITHDPDHGGGGALGRHDPNSSSDWLYGYAFHFNGTCVAHGAVSSYVGLTLAEIIASSASLSTVVDGDELHQRFIAAAESGGAWVSYSWLNGPNELPYEKLAYVKMVKRCGQAFYLGVGMGNRDWTEQIADLPDTGGGTSRWGWGCSIDYQHPCSEDWALAVAGSRMSSMLTAATQEQLMATFALGSGGQFGFEAHVHNNLKVIYDGHDSSFVGMTREAWMRVVGLSASDLDGHETTGSWLGPFEMRLKRGGEVKPRYLLYLQVHIGDAVADNVTDGVGDTYTVLVAVGAIDSTNGEPMMTAVGPTMAATDAHYCLQRSTMDLESQSGSVGEADRIKCVTDWTAISEHELAASCDVNNVCYGSGNDWDPETYTTDLACVEAAAAENTTDAPTDAVWCSCMEGYVPRYAAPRILGSSMDITGNTSAFAGQVASALPSDAQCAAPMLLKCTPGDNSCANHKKLQLTFEQLCQLEDEPFSPSPGLITIVSVAFLCVLCVPGFFFERARRRSKMRQLRYVQTAGDFGGGYVVVPPVVESDFAHLPGREPSKCFHLFLSHAWPLGQSVVQLIKQRSHEMCPSMRCFLDVDDLVSGSGTKEVDHSKEVLVLAMPVYFQKVNCVKELFRAIVRKKSITLLLPDAEIHGAFTQAMISEIVTDEWVSKWKLGEKIASWAKEWGVDPSTVSVPTPKEICDALFAQPPLEWSRIPAFQNQTMKLIIQRVLPAKWKKVEVYLPSDPVFIPPKSGKKKQADPIKVYCSPHNKGAAALAQEVAALWPSLLVIEEKELDDTCDHLLVYLNGNTWAEETQEDLTADIATAQSLGIHLQPVHEFPSLIDHGSERAALEFKSIMDATPSHLKSGSTNIYKQIAIALKSHDWRKVGLVNTAKRLAERHPKVPIEPEPEGDGKNTRTRGRRGGSPTPGASGASQKLTHVVLSQPERQSPVPPATDLYAV